MDHYAKAYPIFSRIRGWRRYQSMVASLRRFSENEAAQQRLKIIQFYEKHGEEATTAYRICSVIPDVQKSMLI